MKFFSICLIILSLSLGFTACGSGGSGGNDGNITKQSDNLGEMGKSDKPGPFSAGDFGNITLTRDYKIPSNALFLDIRNEWERENGGFAKGSVGGAVYEFRVAGDDSQDRVRDEFVDEVLALVENDKNRLIILICSSGSRTGAKGNKEENSAAKLLSLNGFTNVYHIMGGFNGSMGWKANDLSVDRYIN